jgi:large conductance mechanosensitive channel
MLEEFKKFILRGNVMDLAVGVIIGAAFGKIVDSLVADVIMPIVGRIIGSVDFSNMYLILADAKNGAPYASLDAARKAGANVLAYGNFLTILVNFVILAFIIFMLIKAVNKLMTKEAQGEAPAAPPPPPEDVVLLREIRDSLRAAR